MTVSFRASLLLMLPLLAVIAGCADREEDLGDPVPPGVSLEPPPPAPTPGGLVLPGGAGSDSASAETAGGGAMPEGQATGEVPAVSEDTATSAATP